MRLLRRPCGHLLDLIFMLAGHTTHKQIGLPGQLEGDIHDALPIDWTSGCIGGWRKAGTLHGVDSSLAETVPEIASNAQYLNRSRSRDAEANRYGALDMLFDRLRSVLRTRLVQDLRRRSRAGIGRGRGWSSRGRRDSTEVDRASRLAATRVH